MKLNLKATNPAEERIKAYLEANASESLARKINEGTPFVKDGTLLKNVKTLSGFMEYATKEAQKIAEKGARFACIDDTTVFGWSIHYFEEEAIVGELLTADGKPYKAEKPTPKAPQKPLPKTEPKPTAQKTATILPTAKVAEAPKPTQEKPKKKTNFHPSKSKPTEAYQSQPKPTTNTSYTVHEQISLFDMI